MPSNSPAEAWEDFFRKCDLPPSVCRKYAQKFVKERIQPYMLKELNKDNLKELGIDALGDQLAIMRFIKTPSALAEFGKVQASAEDDEDEVLMDTDVKQRVVKSTLQSAIRQKGVSSVRQRESTPIVRFSAIDTKSRVIRKKPVMIHDISSSQPIRSIGSMRSDAISLKTTVVPTSPEKQRGTALVRSGLSRLRNEVTASSSQRNPDFRVRINLRPQVAYDDLLDDIDAYEEEDDNLTDSIDPTVVNRVISTNAVRRQPQAPLNRAAVRGLPAERSAAGRMAFSSSFVRDRGHRTEPLMMMTEQPDRHTTYRRPPVMVMKQIVKPSLRVERRVDAIQARVERRQTSSGLGSGIRRRGGGGNILNRISVVKMR